uniref:Ankyrin repeat domain-containing protein n=1 Tax=Phaeomonas parva TaxID=124430 RepID=A0A7S1UGA5_9STRA|mmetsp:Transcript_46795/g.146063  ORF Transcript_46795/g.146063 Transcript_46795/m.146063 type:complete len:188 (+) Transcript_46795:79-642(+)
MRAPPPLLLLLALPLAAAQMAVNDVPDERLKYLTELHRAAVEGDEALARAALAADPLSINFAGADHHWVSPLYAAAEHGNVSVLRLLLEAGADASQETADGSTPLLAAANFEEEEVPLRWLWRWRVSSSPPAPTRRTATSSATTPRRSPPREATRSSTGSCARPRRASSTARRAVTVTLRSFSAHRT